jgi:hypothetical protein
VRPPDREVEPCAADQDPSTGGEGDASAALLTGTSIVGAAPRVIPRIVYADAVPLA